MTGEDNQKERRELVYVQPAYMQGDDEIDLLELWDILWQGKWFIVGFTFLCTVGAIVYSPGFATPKYRAQATLEPTQESRQVIVNYLGSNKFHRYLIEKYNLLPRMYPELWDEQAKKWNVQQENRPIVEKVLASGKGFPLEVENNKQGPVKISWTGQNLEFCACMLENIIKELRTYLQDDYKSSAQVRIDILKQELDSLLQKTANAKSMDQQVLASIAGLQSKIADLKGENYLVRRFSVIDEPITPQHPFEPNKKLIVALAFVLGGFVSIFLVFFKRFVQNARQRRQGQS